MAYKIGVWQRLRLLDMMILKLVAILYWTTFDLYHLSNGKQIVEVRRINFPMTHVASTVPLIIYEVHE